MFYLERNLKGFKMFDLGTRILVIDDMMTMRKIVSKSCRDLGFTNIIEAADGALGWQALCEASPAIGLIISDWNMPNCTGVELLRRVRGDKRFAHLPFVLVTAESEQSQIVEAIKAGVSGYVVKPFAPNSLKDKLEVVHKNQLTAAKVA
jgi:two-component system chemotaxis response regulator CheY